ncbi:hypothetical protein [Streptomyces sp. NPDC001070]
MIRTAIGEIRRPGSARHQWTFAANRRSLTAGATASLVVGATGWHQAGPAVLTWAVLAGALVASLANPPPDKHPDDDWA